MSIRHYQESGPSYKTNTFPLLYVTVLVVLLYSIFLVVRSVFDGISQSRALLEQQAQIDQLRLKVEVANRFVAYQGTPNYIEKQARQHFAYIKQGETVVDVPDNVDQSQELANEQAGIKAQAQEKVISPHVQQWWDYYFGK